MGDDVSKEAAKKCGDAWDQVKDGANKVRDGANELAGMSDHEIINRAYKKGCSICFDGESKVLCSVARKRMCDYYSGAGSYCDMLMSAKGKNLASKMSKGDLKSMVSWYVSKKMTQDERIIAANSL